MIDIINGVEIGDYFISRYTLVLILLACITWFLYHWGFFKVVKNITFDCIMDHKTGYYTINNVARFLTMLCFLFLFLVTHFDLQVKPHFQIRTVAFSEWELGLVLAFIIGAEWVKKKDKITETNTPIDNGTL